MENASKALIIAGSILLAVLIVAMGVRVFNKAESSVDTGALDEQEITLFNNKWEKYAGSAVLGSNVKSFISTAIANANTNKAIQSKLPTVKFTVGSTITAAGGSTATANDAGFTNYITNLNNIRKKIISTKTYTITTTYGKDGMVKTITIGT